MDLETLDTQGLLDPADESLDFVRRRESTLKPMAIYRIENEFLLCYDGSLLPRIVTILTTDNNLQSLHSTSTRRGGDHVRTLWCTGRVPPLGLVGAPTFIV